MTCAVFALGMGLLATPAPASAAASALASASASAETMGAPTAQSNVPDLDAPGPAKTVYFPPDNGTRALPAELTLDAPPYTRITMVDLDCSGMTCPVVIAPDGRSATARIDGHNWIWSRPWKVGVVADADAPLAGGRFAGGLTFEGVTVPLEVNITPGVPGAFGGYVGNAPGGAGVVVRYVDPGSGAEASGVTRNDVITAVDGQPTPTVSVFRQVLASMRAGRTVPVTVQRGGTVTTLRLTLDRD